MDPFGLARPRFGGEKARAKVGHVPERTTGGLSARPKHCANAKVFDTKTKAYIVLHS
jgi:hypothetical protein